MPKYFREVNKHFSGDKTTAARYMGVARSLLGGLVEMSGGLFQNARKVVMPDGTKITVWFAGAVAHVGIDVTARAQLRLPGVSCVSDDSLFYLRVDDVWFECGVVGCEIEYLREGTPKSLTAGLGIATVDMAGNVFTCSSLERDRYFGDDDGVLTGLGQVRHCLYKVVPYSASGFGYNAAEGVGYYARITGGQYEDKKLRLYEFTWKVGDKDDHIDKCLSEWPSGTGPSATSFFRDVTIGGAYEADVIVYGDSVFKFNRAGTRAVMKTYGGYYELYLFGGSWLLRKVDVDYNVDGEREYATESETPASCASPPDPPTRAPYVTTATYHSEVTHTLYAVDFSYETDELQLLEMHTTYTGYGTSSGDSQWYYSEGYDRCELWPSRLYDITGTFSGSSTTVCTLGGETLCVNTVERTESSYSAWYDTYSGAARGSGSSFTSTDTHTRTRWLNFDIRFNRFVVCDEVSVNTKTEVAGALCLGDIAWDVTTTGSNNYSVDMSWGGHNIGSGSNSTGSTTTSCDQSITAVELGIENPVHSAGGIRGGMFGASVLYRHTGDGHNGALVGRVFLSGSPSVSVAVLESGVCKIDLGIAPESVAIARYAKFVQETGDS